MLRFLLITSTIVSLGAALWISRLGPLQKPCIFSSSLRNLIILEKRAKADISNCFFTATPQELTFDSIHWLENWNRENEAFEGFVKWAQLDPVYPKNPHHQLAQTLTLKIKAEVTPTLNFNGPDIEYQGPYPDIHLLRRILVRSWWLRLSQKKSQNDLQDILITEILRKTLWGDNLNPFDEVKLLTKKEFCKSSFELIEFQSDCDASKRMSFDEFEMASVLPWVTDHFRILIQQQIPLSHQRHFLQTWIQTVRASKNIDEETGWRTSPKKLNLHLLKLAKAIFPLDLVRGLSHFFGFATSFNNGTDLVVLKLEKQISGQINAKLNMWVDQEWTRPAARKLFLEEEVLQNKNLTYLIHLPQSRYLALRGHMVKLAHADMPEKESLAENTLSPISVVRSCQAPRVEDLLKFQKDANRIVVAFDCSQPQLLKLEPLLRKDFSSFAMENETLPFAQIHMPSLVLAQKWGLSQRAKLTFHSQLQQKDSLDHLFGFRDPSWNRLLKSFQVQAPLQVVEAYRPPFGRYPHFDKN